MSTKTKSRRQINEHDVKTVDLGIILSAAQQTINNNNNSSTLAVVNESGSSSSSSSSSSCLTKLYNRLLTDQIGSEAHVSEFSTLLHALITLTLLAIPPTLATLYPYYKSIHDDPNLSEWTYLQMAEYAFTIGTWIVLVNVMMKFDWTRLGTFFELFHPMTEIALVLAVYEVQLLILWIIPILYIFILVPIIRLTSDKQYAWAVILGTLSHLLIIIPLFVRTGSDHWSENVNDRKRLLIPFAIVLHFTYDVTMGLFAIFKPASCLGKQPFKYQIWLTFCNVASICIMYTHLFLELYE